MPLSLAFSLHCRFCVNDYIANTYAKIACNSSSGHYVVRLQVIQPFLKSYFFLAHKVSLKSSLKLSKSLKRLSSLAYTQINQTKYRFSSVFALVCICWTFLHKI